MIDAENLRYPVFDKIIANCRRNPSVKEYKNIENNMNTFVHESCEFGHISKEVYDRLNIVRDRDSMGCEVICRMPQLHKKDINAPNALVMNTDFISKRNVYLRISGSRLKGRSWLIVNITRR